MTPAQADAVRILSRIEIGNLNERLFITELARHPDQALDARKAGYLGRIAVKHGVALAEDTAAAGSANGEMIAMIPVAACRPSPSARPVVPIRVAELAASIRDVGLRQPINVRPLQDGGFEIRGGGHRVAAFAELGRATIPAFVRDDGDLLAELAEIDENLIRNELGPAERAAAVARRKGLYEALHPEAKVGAGTGGKARRTKDDLANLAKSDEQDVDGRDGPGHDGEGAAPRFTQATAAATGASERTIRREAERGATIGEAALRKVAGTSLDKGEELDALARLPEDKRAPLIERAAAGEKVSAKTEAKKDRRETRERELGARQAALPEKRFGVILADPEWEHVPWSDAGLAKSAVNHYPVSSIEVIKARPVGDIAARDSVLFLWSTVPHLDQALETMRAWGFAYRTCAIWNKTYPGQQQGMGYWFRINHEVLLVGTRGDVPAPAPGTQFGSVFSSEPRGHSIKPDWQYDLIEAYFPTLPKIELNARARRPGWDAWGLEAPGDEGRAG